jgi:hypothetical protein
MADNTYEYGFRWVKGELGQAAPPIQRIRLATAYQPAAGGTNVDLHPGDPVQILSTGYGGICVGSEGTQSIIYGIYVGQGPEFDGTVMQPRNKHIGGSGAYGTNLERMTYAYVIPVAGQVFEIACDDSSTFTTEATYLASIGENADFVLVADTTNANDPKATPKLDISTHNTSSALQCRIVDIAPRVNTDFTGLNVNLRVTFNKVQQAPYNTTGV